MALAISLNFSKAFSRDRTAGLVLLRDSLTIGRLLTMKGLKARFLPGAIVLLILMAKTTSAQLEPSCEKNSPERRGEIGCSLVENKPLPEGLRSHCFGTLIDFLQAKKPEQ
jgi:hypothetical protein